MEGKDIIIRGGLIVTIVSALIAVVFIPIMANNINSTRYCDNSTIPFYNASTDVCQDPANASISGEPDGISLSLLTLFKVVTLLASLGFGVALFTALTKSY